MVQKMDISVLFVTAVLVIGVNGLRLFDFTSSSEDIYDDPDYDLVLDEDRSDNQILFDDFIRLFDVQASTDDTKWEEIDNLELIEFTQDDQFVEMVQLKQYSEMRGMKTYTLGKRVKGDGVVAFSEKNQTWPQFQDIQSNLTYPAKGVVGKNLTFVEIQVNQTSNLGDAYVLQGGISKRFITIIVKAYRTLYFNWKASFYGF